MAASGSTESTPTATPGTIKALDGTSVHRIASGQVVVDLQTAVKELLENSLDAGATTIEIKFKHQGLHTIEVIDNGSGVAAEDYDAIALKHHTSKLTSFTDLTQLHTFGFRGEALSSLCALAEQVTVTTATKSTAPMGAIILFDRAGRVSSRSGKTARQRGTTVAIKGLFKPLPVRRKELERNAKREFGKALGLLSAYALVPCAQENKGVRLTVTHQPDSGKKSVPLRTDGTPSTRASVSALWGPKALEQLVDLDLEFTVGVERAVLRRQGLKDQDGHDNKVQVRGLISKFVVGGGRMGTDRQFFFINGRPCSPSKVQKAFNEVYRTFNANQSPFIVADFILPKDSMDVNVSPDKRTILLHSENNLIQALKTALESTFAPSRATYGLNATQSTLKASIQAPAPSQSSKAQEPLFIEDDEDEPEGVECPDPTVDMSMDVDDIHDEDGFGEPRLLMRSESMTGDNDQVQGWGKLDHGDAGVSFEHISPSSEFPSSPQQAPEPEIEVGPSTSEAATRMASATVQDEIDASAEDLALPDDLIDLQKPSPTATQTESVIPQRVAPTRAGSALDGNDEELQIAKIAGPSSVRSVSPRPCQPKRPLAPSRAVSRPRASDDGSRSVQTVLSTSGASWNLQPRTATSEDDARPRKRRKIDEGQKTGKDARQVLRAQLRSFARTGSQVVDVEMEDEEAAEKDEAEESAEESGQKNEPEEDEDTTGDRSIRSSELGGAALQDVDMNDDEPVPVSERRHRSPASSTLDDENDITPEVSSILDASQSPSARPEVLRTADGEEIALRFSFSRTSSAWSRLQDRTASAAALVAAAEKSRLTDDAGLANADEEKAAEALSRVIDKADFATMEVSGQFNLGFIIVRRRKRFSGSGAEGGVEAPMDDLFIVDQHAADEKYNFETLQQTTKIDSQKLFRPQPLELTAADEILATENMSVLRQNGFELDFDEDISPGEGHRLKLTAQPISKGTVFDVKDLEELLHLMQDRPTGQMVRCSKARAMFASRACRKSVMIGMPLSRQQMTSVIRHMGTMDQPWHCPHGRPTVRHLSDLNGLGRDLRDNGRAVDWKTFGLS